MLLTYLRSLLVVFEEGSINRAAARLQISQPALSRQMQALEQLVGGRLFERGSGGVRPTDAGHRLARSARSVLASADDALAEARQLARGQHSQIRVGCLMSAAQPFMSKALLTMRESHPEVKVKFADLSPGEMIASLRRGDLDVALTGQEGSVLGREFYTRSLVRLPVMAAMPASHPLAQCDMIALRELKNELFIGAPDEELPGRNQWIRGLCRKVGFRPRFGPEGHSIAQVFSLIVGEPGVTLLPSYLRSYPYAGVKLVDLEDKTAQWDLLVVWHRGRPSAALTVLLKALASAATAR
jgi:DNA-binding transcriptional LysR family regulator